MKKLRRVLVGVSTVLAIWPVAQAIAGGSISGSLIHSRAVNPCLCGVAEDTGQGRCFADALCDQSPDCGSDADCPNGSFCLAESNCCSVPKCVAGCSPSACTVAPGAGMCAAYDVCTGGGGGPCDPVPPDAGDDSPCDPVSESLSFQEAKCVAALAKRATKLAKTAAAEMAKCRQAALTTGVTCPTAEAGQRIAAAAAQLETSAAQACFSACSVSQNVSCVADSLCPPLSNTHEVCSGGAQSNPFDIHNMGFPGPFCETVLGHRIVNADDLGACVSVLVPNAALALANSIYGSISGPISEDAAQCLSSISKAAQKLSQTVLKGVVKCRQAISGGGPGDPATCRTSDPRLAEKIAKAECKLAVKIDSCSDAAILQLDLCENGLGGTPNRAAARSCVIAAVNEITDTKVSPPQRSYYSGPSLVESIYPPTPVCGNGVMDQIRGPFAVLGEECDGDDDTACPGQCLPPGDAFECTCGDRTLLRFLADASSADLDSGWRGTFHDAGVPQGAGYVTEATGCNCSALTGATCTGTTSDAVCNLAGSQSPQCSWDFPSSIRCDQHGNNNGTDSDSDCFVCDEFTANAGALCVNESQCVAQCYDGNGVPAAPCDTQADCNPSEVCHGQCDRTQTCMKLPNGAPLPMSFADIPLCVLSTFRNDVSGTHNIVTGEHAVSIRQFSRVLLGLRVTKPCPVCGGFCAGGVRADEVCEGTCSGSFTACRFDVDCPSGETCTSVSSDCPGSTCVLSAVCSGGPNDCKPCRVEAVNTRFGTTSNDCPPDTTGGNISGEGLAIEFLPTTSEIVSLPPTLACSQPGYELYSCPCPQAGGRGTQPNNCAAACNAGVEHGKGCATGAGNTTGMFTTCAVGANAGRACDQDPDCPGSTCSVNPRHCSGGAPGDERKSCTTNADCGGGGSCVDACPSGRCVPLCLASNDPNAPLNAKNDGEEGVCAAGPPTYHCGDDTYLPCDAADAGGGCSAVCASTCSSSGVPGGGSGSLCDPTNACGGGEICCGVCPRARNCEAGIAVDAILGNADDIPGAGVCVADVSNCFFDDATAEGGDTLNGEGDPTDARSVTAYCIGATSNAAVNNEAGLGGPGRLRVDGVNVANKASIP